MLKMSIVDDSPDQEWRLIAVVDDKPSVTIYTDGGASPNPGPGGWGVVLIHDSSGVVKELYGGDPHTTNNRMELTAAIRAIEALKSPCIVTIHTDSEYLRYGITEWLPKWIKRNWTRGKNKDQEIQNEDLWRVLADRVPLHEIRWEWVKGHAGDRHNERADWLASQAIREFRAEADPIKSTDAQIYLGVSVRDGKGSWGALVRYDGEEEILTGEESGVTANFLDIMAAREALMRIPERVHVHIYSYSDYLRNGATQWIGGWRKRNWKTKDGNPVKNREAWQALEEELSIRRVEWPSLKDEVFPPIEFEQLEEAIREGQQEQNETWDI
jgi:ribonuclease HI